METTSLPVKTIDIEIHGTIKVPENVFDSMQFLRELDVWMESKGYKFSGGVHPFDENDLPY